MVKGQSEIGVCLFGSRALLHTLALLFWGRSLNNNCQTTCSMFTLRGGYVILHHSIASSITVHIMIYSITLLYYNSTGPFITSQARLALFVAITDQLYIYIYTHVFMYMFMYVYIYIYICTHVCIRIVYSTTYMHIYTCMCIYVCVHICVYPFLSLSIYKYIERERERERERDRCILVLSIV